MRLPPRDRLDPADPADPQGWWWGGDGCPGAPRRVLSCVRFEDGISALAVSPDESCFAAATLGGDVTVRARGHLWSLCLSLSVSLLLSFSVSSCLCFCCMCISVSFFLSLFACLCLLLSVSLSVAVSLCLSLLVPFHHLLLLGLVCAHDLLIFCLSGCLLS